MPGRACISCATTCCADCCGRWRAPQAFDDAALQRLCFVRAAFEAGISLDALTRLYRALDAADANEAATQLAVLRQFVERRREALADLEVQLATLPTEPAQHAESLP